MRVWVIIPVKPLYRAKSRLASVLSPGERQRLAETLLRHVLQAATPLDEVAGTLVISRDPRALAIAREHGAKTVQESGTPELNTALTRASGLVRTWGCRASLVLPADLPFLQAEDVRQMIKLSKDEPGIVIATDDESDGTNALLMRPQGVIPYSYGAGSFERHIKLAREAGITITRYESKRLQIDIDVPQDLKRYTEIAAELGLAPITLFVPDQP